MEHNTKPQFSINEIIQIIKAEAEKKRSMTFH